MSPDKTYMRMALRLAKKGMGITSPNPMVGAVVVKDGRVIGRGYHQGPGTLHAEAVAIRDAGTEAKGATLYTNLEPCCHTDKRTPPCTKEIIRSEVRRVVIAMEDPNPMVNGRGIRELAGAGIQVEKEILYPEAVRLNESYSKFISTKVPFVILKSASSLDGKIALPSGESKWITGESARRCSHQLRAMVDAVLVGIGTLLADDPLLSVRGVRLRGKQPLRIIVDSQLRTPLTAKALDQGGGQETMVVTTKAASSAAMEALEKTGVKTLIAASREDGDVSLTSMMRELGKMGISSVLIEGGSRINASAFREGVVDKVVIFYSPRIIGGSDSIGMVGGGAPASLDKSIFLKDISIRRLGEDILVEGYVRKVMSDEICSLD